MITTFKRPLLIIFLAMFSFIPSAFAKDAIYTSFFSDKAISGYDAVSYFSGTGEPVKGNTDFSTEWRGATWLFASQENLDTFTSNPEKYAPQYGGYCAWAMADGKFASGDPEIFDIVDGKLYLNYNKDIQNKWTIDKSGFINSANQQYPALVDLN